jgi:hypothetical protein
MDKFDIVEMQRFVDAGDQLTHEQGLLLLDKFPKQGVKLSHEDSLMFSALGALLKKRKLPRLRVVPADLFGHQMPSLERRERSIVMTCHS